MGLFTAPKNMTPQQRREAADRWAVVGATLQDLGSTLNGGQGGAVQNVREMMRRRADQSDLASVFASPAPSAIGGQEQGIGAPMEPQQPFSYTPPSLNNPGTVQKLTSLMTRGVNIKDALELLKASDASRKVEVANGVAYNPFQTAPGSRIGVNLQNVNGAMVDPNDPSNVNRYIPKLEDGAEPLYDRHGNVVGQRLLDGTTQAIGARAAAQSAGQAAGQAPFQLETVQTEGGQVTAPRSSFLSGMVPGLTPGERTNVFNKNEEDKTVIDTARGINSILGQHLKQLDSGELKLGPIANVASSVKNMTGNSDANSVAFSTFRSDLEKLRNDSLRLNAGVQTEGDAQRAWKELISNINDPKVVRAQLQRIMTLNERAIGIKEQRIAQRPGSQPQTSYRAPPPAAVQYLRNNPAMRQAFDAKYGQGSAARVLGQ